MNGLVSFPLPLLTALLCCAVARLIWRVDLGVRRASATLSLAFVLGAVESSLVAMRFGYGVRELIPLQGVLPLFLGPLLYLSFAALRLDAKKFRNRAALHLALPVLAVALLWGLTRSFRLLDGVIATSYLSYIAALVLLWRLGPDALIHAPVSRASQLSGWMLAAIGLLSFILALDTVIALDFMRNDGAHAGRLISFGTIFLVLILCAVLMAISRTRGMVFQAPKSDPQDDFLEARLHQIITTEQLFLDPGLTVARLAKRLHVPARAVSSAVNRSKGMNMSQYVNSYRLAHAADLLRSDGANVKQIAEASGFLSRSNFYREFQRVHNMSPGEYRNGDTRPAVDTVDT